MVIGTVNLIPEIVNSSQVYVPTGEKRGGGRTYKAGRKEGPVRQKKPSNGRFPQICHHHHDLSPELPFRFAVVKECDSVRRPRPQGDVDERHERTVRVRQVVSV